MPDVSSSGRSAPPAPVRCRRIREDDLPALARLLDRGFPDRGEAWWRRSLDRLWGHAAGMEQPDCGCLLEAGGVPVGALLLVHGRGGAGGPGPRCNLSSWFVEPGHASYAPLLVAQATKRRDVTYVNVSPAPHTLPIIAAQGFAPYGDSRILSMPWGLAPAHGARVRRIGATRDLDGIPEAEAAMVARHLAHGCLGFRVDAPDGPRPFLFRVGHLRARVPVATLVYARAMADLDRFAGPLGRALLRRGIPVLAVEAEGRETTLPGWRRTGRAPRYAKGPHPPRAGDLTDTEIALFGL